MRKKKKNRKIATSSKKQKWNIQWQEKLPIWGFLLIFGLGLTLFYIVYDLPFFQDFFVDLILEGQTWIAGSILQIFGEDVLVQGRVLSNGIESIDVRKGCDGVETIAVFILGVLVVPFPFRLKIPGILIGVLALFLLNLIRIIGLYLARMYAPVTFDFLHLHGGFVLFTLVGFLAWVSWAGWAIQQEKLAAIAA